MMLAAYHLLQGHATVLAKSHSIGILAEVVSVAIPLALYLLILRLSSRFDANAYVLRLGVRLIVYTSRLRGGSFAQDISGVSPRFAPIVPSTPMGVPVLSALGGPVFSAILLDRIKVKSSARTLGISLLASRRTYVALP